MLVIVFIATITTSIALSFGQSVDHRVIESFFQSNTTSS